MSSDMWRYLLHNPQIEELVTAVKAIAPRLPVQPTKPLDLQPCIDRINRDNLEYLQLMAKSPALVAPEIQLDTMDLSSSVVASAALLVVLLTLKTLKDHRRRSA